MKSSDVRAANPIAHHPLCDDDGWDHPGKECVVESDLPPELPGSVLARLVGLDPQRTQRISIECDTGGYFHVEATMGWVELDGQAMLDRVTGN